MATRAGYEGTYWITAAEQRLLFRLLRAIRGDYLEIGSFDGIVATEIARRFPDRQIHCVDLFQAGHATNAGHRAIFEANLARHQVRNVCIFEGDSRSFVPALAAGYGVAFVDGDHAYAAVLADLRNAWAKLAPDGWLAFHDYGHVADVTRAVDDFLQEQALRLAVRVDSVGVVARPRCDARELRRLRRWARRQHLWSLGPRLVRALLRRLPGGGPTRG